MIVEKGRPTDISGRLEKEIKSYDFLDTLGFHMTELIMRQHLQWKLVTLFQRHWGL